MRLKYMEGDVQMAHTDTVSRFSLLEKVKPLFTRPVVRFSRAVLRFSSDISMDFKVSRISST